MSSKLARIVVLGGLVIAGCASGNGAPPARVDPAPDREPIVSAATPTPAPGALPAPTPPSEARIPERSAQREIPSASQTCRADSECQAVDDYCEGCACQALARSSPLPQCSGRGVSCFVAPCHDKTAVCRDGRCQLGAKPGGSQM
jgi:hypothetical protein